jgi:hypothetical protein
MCIALVGGMDRLRAHYVGEAEKSGVELKVFNVFEPKMAAKIRSADAVLLFTNKVSHKARREVVAAARSAGIPVHCIHSCGLCTLRDCLRCLVKERIPTDGGPSGTPKS